MIFTHNDATVYCELKNNFKKRRKAPKHAYLLCNCNICKKKNKNKKTQIAFILYKGTLLKTCTHTFNLLS